MNRPPGTVSFLGAPVEVDASRVRADFAFLGIPYGVPYDMENVSPLAAAGPAAVRAASEAMIDEIGLLAYDFDLGKPLLAGNKPSVLVDCGDVYGDPRDLPGNAVRATQAVRGILAGGGVPLVVGGDHAIPPLVAAAFESAGPIDVLQIDAHLDFVDERHGVHEADAMAIVSVGKAMNDRQGLDGVGGRAVPAIDGDAVSGFKEAVCQDYVLFVARHDFCSAFG